MSLKPKNSRKWRRPFLVAVFGIAFVLMFFRWFEHKQVYHPTRTLDIQPGRLEPRVDDVYFKTSDGVKLNAWFFSAKPKSTGGQFAVILCHGNGGNISHRIEVCELLREAGLSVLSFDYRGYGLSEGRPSEEGTYRDAKAAHEWLRTKGFDPRRIIAYGESLGGGVASELCRREPTGGLILQSTFTSIPDIGAEFYPWLPIRLLGRIRYDTLSRLPELKVPVLVMHSREDGLIGYKHSERNFEAANEPKMFCEIQGDHNDPLTDRDGFIGGIQKFISLVQNREPEPVR